MNLLADTHAHLDFPQFNPDREEVLARARQQGIGLMINVGTGEQSSYSSVKLAEKHPDIYAAVGVHPHYAARVTPRGMEKIASLAAHAKVVAVGETGLESSRNLSPPEVQERIFREHLRLAAALDKPVIVHTREAYAETLRVLREEALPSRPGVMHCFGGNASQAASFLEMGFYLSLAGPVTYPASHGLRSLLEIIPAERLLLETDAPYLSPQPYRGRRNEPAFIAATYRRVSVALGLGLEALAEQVWQNACRLFGPCGLK